MVENENCRHGNSAPFTTLNRLPFTQAGIERHKCVICAYSEGYALGLQLVITLGHKLIYSYSCAHGKTAPDYLIDELPESQAGTGRHRCAVCAFEEGLLSGFEAGNMITVEERFSNLPDGKLTEVIKTISTRQPSISTVFTTNRNVDYPKVYDQNQKVGLLGELLVLSHEKQKLAEFGRVDLAKSVKHVSVEEGDGVGYDILSYTIKGEKKYIEVKTTVGDINNPFYLTINELHFSQEHSSEYYLYRLFDLDLETKKASYYIFQGNLDTGFSLEPIMFRVTN